MKTLTISILSIIIFSGTIFAQGGRNFEKRNEIKKKQVAFISNELQLTEKEKTNFIPLYQDYVTKKEALHQKKRTNMQSFHKNNLNMSDEELTKLVDLFINTDIQLAELNKTYHNKYKKALSPMKIILLHQAEQRFKRELFKQIRRKGSGGKSRL